MRALITTQPGFGHLNPLLPYATALRAAGHEVRVASAPSFAEAIERHGFPFEAIGADFTWERAAEFFPGSAEAGPAGRGMEFAVFDITWKRWHPQATADLLALFDRWRPDVILREFAENGATFAGELAGVPVVCAAWGALPTDRRSWSQVWDWDRMLACYDDLRSQLGLVADRPGGAWERQPAFSALPPSWIGAAADTVDVRHFRVPPLEGPPTEPPDWLSSLGRDRPLVYATLGTVYNKMRRLRATILEALGGLPADVLMTVGRDVDPAAVGPVPGNVRLEPFVAQSLVIPRASLLVSHAGLGTLLGAIYAGVPMVLVGIDGDQPVNADRAASLQVARAVALGADPAEWLAAAEAVLRDEQTRSRALALRAECAAMAPVEDAVRALEEVAASGPRPEPPP